MLPISDSRAVKLTTALYFTPNGRSIQAEGIEPDIVLDYVKVQSEAKADLKPLKEADLRRHLEGNGGSDKSPANRGEKGKSSLAERDFQLNEALNLLKGLYLMHPPSKT